jgi:hypothetical protein
MSAAAAAATPESGSSGLLQLNGHPAGLPTAALIEGHQTAVSLLQKLQATVQATVSTASEAGGASQEKKPEQQRRELQQLADGLPGILHKLHAITATGGALAAAAGQQQGETQEEKQQGEQLEAQQHQQGEQQQQQQGEQEQEQRGKQQQEQEQEEGAAAAAAARGGGGGRYSAAAIMRLIKQEPGLADTAAVAAAAGEQPPQVQQQQQAAAAAAAAAGYELSNMPGAAALALLREATAAGFLFPCEQQMGYFVLADAPFAAGELLQLYQDNLAPSFVATRAIGRGNRSGVIREAQMGVPVKHSRFQHQYPRLAPGMLALRDAVPQLEARRPRPQHKRHKAAASGSSQKTDAAEAAALQTPAAARLLLALRALKRWEAQRITQPALPALLQLLLFGGPRRADPDDEVPEVVSLVSDEEDERLDQQLLEGDEEVVVAKVVQPKAVQRRGSGDSGSGGGGGGGDEGARAGGHVRVKRERGA